MHNIQKAVVVGVLGELYKIAKLLGHLNMSTLRHYVLRDYNDINYSYSKIGSVA